METDAGNEIEYVKNRADDLEKKNNILKKCCIEPVMIKIKWSRRLLDGKI